MVVYHNHFFTNSRLQIIQNKSYEIRGLKVILDKDLAAMYEVTTGNLNKAVKRNADKFPDDFMFQLTNEEFDLIFQNGTSSWGGTPLARFCKPCQCKKK